VISLGYCLLGNGQNSDPGGPLASTSSTHTHTIAACKGPMNDIGAPCRFFWDDSFSAAKEGISDHCISSGDRTRLCDFYGSLLEDQRI